MRIGSIGVSRAVIAAGVEACKHTSFVSHPSSAKSSFVAHLRPNHASTTAPAPVAPRPAGELATPDRPFEQRVAAVAARLRVQPDDLLAVMRFESGMRPDAINPATHAVGLIQFMPHTAADLLGLPPGMPGRERQAVETVAAMSADDQLDLVEAYFERALGGRGSDNLRDTYMAVLYPNAVGHGDGYAIAHADGASAFERAVYRQNSALDANGDGVITAGEAAARVAGVRA